MNLRGPWWNTVVVALSLVVLVTGPVAAGGVNQELAVAAQGTQPLPGARGPREPS